MSAAAAGAAAPRERLEWVDAFRGIAAFGVTAYHAMIPLWLSLQGIRAAGIRLTWVERAGALVSIPIHYGYDGVMVFFVISGFVIHLGYADGRTSFTLRPYLVRRFVRLYPPYLAALGLSVLVAAATVPNWRGDDKILPAALLAQNYPHGGGPQAILAALQPAGNIALWSLPVEFELYLAYPVLLVCLARFGLARVCAAVIALGVVSTFVDVLVAPPLGAPATLASFQPTVFHYLIVWAAGAWLAERLVTRTLPAWTARRTLALVTAIALALTARTTLALPKDVEDYVAGAVTVLVLLRVVTHAPSLACLGGRALRPLRDLGAMSYSLYLVHMPFFLLVASFVVRPGGTRPVNYFVSLGAALAAVPVAYVFHRIFERPSIALARRLGRAPHVRRYAETEA